jgi:hypothetical protein
VVLVIKSNLTAYLYIIVREEWLKQQEDKLKEQPCE